MLELEVNDQVRLNDYGKFKAVGKYIVPSCTTPDAMDHEAKKIVDEMRRDILSAPLRLSRGQGIA